MYLPTPTIVFIIYAVIALCVGISNKDKGKEGAEQTAWVVSFLFVAWLLGLIFSKIQL
jgi:hypothetical protein